MRILGLDVGTKTIGVAVSDELGWTAQGVGTISRDENDARSGIKEVGRLIDQYRPKKIVVGLPKNMDGSIGKSGKACRTFAKRLKEAYNVPVELWDERLSTAASEKVLIAADVSRKKRKKVIDKTAAVYILQGYLDSMAQK